MFLETSALSSENISESFLQCARIILSKISSGLDRWRLLKSVLIGSPLFLGSIDPYRMYSGIQCNRLLAAAAPDRSLTQERPQTSSRSCSLCQTWLNTDLYDSSSVREHSLLLKRFHDGFYSLFRSLLFLLLFYFTLIYAYEAPESHKLKGSILSSMIQKWNIDQNWEESVKILPRRSNWTMFVVFLADWHRADHSYGGGHRKDNWWHQISSENDESIWFFRGMSRTVMVRHLGRSILVVQMNYTETKLGFI